MAFCKYCGKELETEQLCDCEQAVASGMHKEQLEECKTQENSATDLLSQTHNAQVKDYVRVSSDKAKEAWSVFYNVIKHPKTGGISFVNSGCYKNAIVFIVLQAVFSGFFACMIIGKINSVIAWGGEYLAAIRFSGARAFFVTLLFSLILSVVLIGIYWGMFRLFKIKEDIKVVLKLVAVRSIGVLPLIFISYIGFALNIPFGILLFVFSSVAGFLFLDCSIGAVGAEDKQPYMALLAIGIMIVVLLLFACKGYVMYLPDSIKVALKQIDSIPDLIDMLGSF